MAVPPRSVASSETRRLPSSRTACGRRRGSHAWASVLLSCAGSERPGRISPGYPPAPMPGPSASVRSSAPEATSADTRVGRPVRGRGARGAGTPASRRARRGQAGPPQGRRRARGRARRGPASRADRGPRRTGRSSTQAGARGRGRRGLPGEGARHGLPVVGAPGEDGVAGALVEGTLLALYSFDRFKSSNDGEAAGGVETVEIAGDGVDGDEVERARVAATAANAARSPEPSVERRHPGLSRRARGRDRGAARLARDRGARSRCDRRARHARWSASVAQGTYRSRG